MTVYRKVIEISIKHLVIISAHSRATKSQLHQNEVELYRQLNGKGMDEILTSRGNRKLPGVGPVFRDGC